MLHRMSDHEHGSRDCCGDVENILSSYIDRSDKFEYNVEHGIGKIHRLGELLDVSS